MDWKIFQIWGFPLCIPAQVTVSWTNIAVLFDTLTILNSREPNSPLWDSLSDQDLRKWI